MSDKPVRQLLEGKPVLLVIDIQQDSMAPIRSGRDIRMPGYVEKMNNAIKVIDAAQAASIPVVYFQEAHRDSLVDFGRELDGYENVHCLESDPGTAIAKEAKMRPQDHFIRKRRYSCFFGTELEILLKGLKAETLVLVGGFTDVCIHYTFVDGHQHDYFCRVAEDGVGGSSLEAHEAALTAMEYMQTGARRQSEEIVAAFEQYAATVETE